ASVVASLDHLSSEARNDISLRVELAAAYLRAADVQAQRTGSSFGLDREALASLEKAEVLLKQARAAQPGNREAANLWFWIESDIANRLYDTGDHERSIERATRTAAQLAVYLKSNAASADAEPMAAHVYSAAARLLLNAGRTAEAM